MIIIEKDEIKKNWKNDKQNNNCYSLKLINLFWQ